MIFFLLQLAVARMLLAHGGDSRPGDFKIIGPGGGGAVFHQTSSPPDSNTFYVAAGDRKKGMFALFTSRDGGQNWASEGELPGLADQLWVNPHSPPDARMLLIAGAHFMEKKTSSGMQKLSGPSAKTFTDISARFSKDGKAFISVIGDVAAFASGDEGTTWRKASL